MMKKKIFTIPNILSFLRILLIPFIAVTYLNGYKYISTGLILASAATDMLDGFIARKFDMISDLGKALDPIADKLTLATVAACLCVHSEPMIILLVIIVVKELALGVEGLMILRKTGTTYSAKWYGKITTVVLYTVLTAHILFDGIPNELSVGLVILCCFLVIASLVLYTRLAVEKIRGAEKSHDDRDSAA